MPTKSKNHTVIVKSLPDCDVCTMRGYKPVRKAKYDSALRGGQHGYSCSTHYFEMRVNTTATILKLEGK